MADAPQLDRPGVDVYQEFTAQRPTILKPSLPAVVIGPAVQVVEAVKDDGSLNSDALISTPARLVSPFISTPFELTGTGGDSLYLHINGEAAVQFVFPGTNPTIAQVVDAINTAAEPGLLALVETSGTQKRLVLHTTGNGENTSLKIGTGTHADILAATGWTLGMINTGSSGYTNYLASGIQYADYPDPRNNLADLTIDYDSVRVFLNPGSGIKEALRTESFLQGRTSAVTVADDGDGDNLSPYLDFASAIFKATAAILTGTADLSATAASILTTTLILNVDGAVVTVNFANPANAAAVVSQINAAAGATIASLNVSNNLVLTSTTTGPGSRIERTGGTVTSGNIGLVIGDADYGSPNRARAQGISDLTAVTYASQVQGRVLKMSINGEQFQTLTFANTVVSAANVVTAINGLWGTGIAALNGGNNLVLLAPDSFGGNESVIRIDKDASDATLLTALGLTGVGAPYNTASAVHGEGMAPIVGDEVWVDGARLGTIVEVPVAPTNRLRLSVEKLLTYTGSTWVIVAKGLTGGAATATRPSANLIVDANTGTIRVKHELFHDTSGAETKAGPLALYLGYDALRLDVTPAKKVSDFAGLSIGLLEDLETALSPIDTQNPLGLGMYYAMLNAPGLSVRGCGIDETTAAVPEGTTDAYARAFEFLESKDVYAMAPLTHSSEVGQIAKAHVVAMSEPTMGSERIALLNPKRPTEKTPTLVASGPRANVSGVPTDVMETGIANLQALLAAAGKPGPTYTESDGVYVMLEDDANHYLVLSVSSGALTINDGPLTQTDGFYYEASGGDVFTTIVVDRPFTVFVRGTAVQNLTDEAAAYADIGRSYLERRVIATAPDKAKSTIDGLETVVEGYYLCAALAGRMSSASPSQGLTEDTLVGFTGVIGSSERYGETGLRIMCGGGLWVFYQEEDTAIVRTRQQLTTDMSTVQKREASITRALDYGAKTLRTSFRNFIGRFNITTGLQEALSLVADSLRDFFVTNGIFASFDVVAIRQSETEPDQIEMDVDVGVLVPLNKIRVTFRVS